MGDDIPVREIFETDGRYIPIESIGAGSFGVVFLVRSYDTNEFYAAKILKPSERNREEYNREVEVYKLLSSNKTPSSIGCYEDIVCLHDNFEVEVNGNIYYVMVLELMTADLWTLIYGETDDDEEIENVPSQNAELMVDYMENLLEGLAYIHSKGLAHNDIKPANILLDVREGLDFYRAKYVDFGLTCTDNTYPAILEKTLRCRIQGSPNYISPDYVITEKPVTLELAQKDDVWALGVVFRFLASGVETYPIAASEFYISTTPDTNPFEFLASVRLGVGEITDEDKIMVYKTDRIPDEEIPRGVSPVSYYTGDADNDFIVNHVINRMSSIDADDRPTAEEMLNYIRRRS